MADCTKCANRNNDYCIFACENGESFKPITNADRVRSMSDEELALILARGCHETRDCPTVLSPLFPYDEAVESCEKCWLDWLRQEAEEWT